MAAPPQLRTLLLAVNALLRKRRYHAALAMIKGFRNGAVYGAKIRAPHALVMTFLFRSGRALCVCAASGRSCGPSCRPPTSTPGPWPALCSPTRDSAPCSPICRARPSRCTHSLLPSSGACCCLEKTIASTTRSTCTCYLASCLPCAAWVWTRATSPSPDGTRTRCSRVWCGGWCCGSLSTTGPPCSPRCSPP
ncbi:peroxisomal membrane protein 4 isoform X2 [Phacochoerus africanus]|uniref:peroxisomal membrane protein 4 isoform X2 n=1 Tax=Phacochoerus africanus TaxID=41426 RepID=UPI001FDAA0DA|nr:peroxisomal membrane protein 4 isoform X2 [Phacochoerus africanus]